MSRIGLTGRLRSVASTSLQGFFRISVACSALLSLHVLSSTAIAQTCPVTAVCTAPQVSAYTYQVSNGYGATARASTEAAAIQAYETLDSANTCSFSLTDMRPPWQPTPAGHGNQQNGNYSDALFGANGQFWSMGWTLSTEVQQTVIPLRINKVFPAQGYYACTGTTQYGAYVSRSREVGCPVGFVSNGTSTTPHNAYCYRDKVARDPAKNLGNQCPLEANPVNVATGNKFQAETDFESGSSPLKFVRYYNSFLTDYNHQSLGPLSTLGPSWRSSYERVLRYGDSALFPTVYAYRPDGRALRFVLAGGQFMPEADVSDRLARLLDSLGTPIGWQFAIAESQETETYDNGGRLLSISTRTGVTQTLQYDSNGRISSVTDSFGHSLGFTYNANGRLATLVDPSGQALTYTYNTTGNVASVTYADATTRTYAYNEPANTSNYNLPYALTGIIDEAQSRFSIYRYDGQRRVLSTEHAGGANKYVLTYPGTLVINQITITDPLLQQRTKTFSTIHGVAKETSNSQPCTTGCSGGSAATTYDVNGNIASKTDFKGNRTCRAYDLTRNLENVRLEGVAAGGSCPSNLISYTPTIGTRERKITTQWHPTYRLPTQIEEPGRRTTYTHDANGNVLTKTILDTSTNESRTWTYTYNSFGQVLTADGPRTDVSDVTTYAYYNCNTGYQCGQVQAITNALGHVTTYNSYNAHGQPLTITDPNGVVTTLTYDLRQRLKTRTIGTELTSFDYWPTGLLQKATLPDGSYLEYTYDAAHRLTDINDSEGNRIHYTLDAMGNRTAEEIFDPSNALTQTSTRVFNTLNQLHKEIGAAGTASVTTTFGYDNNGNQTDIDAPLGRNTDQAYDELNRLTSVTDPLNGVTQYGHNAIDQLISVTDPRNKVTSYQYNALGDLMQQVSPYTGTTDFTYDSAGNLKTRTDARGKTGTYDYDGLNRITSLTYPDQTISYVYDTGTNQKGRLTQVTDNSGSTSWTYDPQGRVLSRQQTMGSIMKTLGYSYDSAGRLHTLSLPSGNTITYGYTEGKLTSLTLNGSTTILSNVLYEPFGPTRGWTWGNNTLAVREYDLDGKITDLDSAGLKTYAYDDAFRITSITDAGDPSLSQTYGYDLLDRLTSATSTSLDQSWTYDANGNRLTQGGSAPSTYTISSTSNRLSSVSDSLSRTYDYDAAGNTTSDGTATYAYDDARRMVTAIKVRRDRDVLAQCTRPASEENGRRREYVLCLR